MLLITTYLQDLLRIVSYLEYRGVFPVSGNYRMHGIYRDVMDASAARYI